MTVCPGMILLLFFKSLDAKKRRKVSQLIVPGDDFPPFEHQIYLGNVVFDVYYLRIEIIFDNCYQSLLSTYFF